MCKFAKMYNAFNIHLIVQSIYNILDGFWLVAADCKYLFLSLFSLVQVCKN